MRPSGRFPREPYGGRAAARSETAVVAIKVALVLLVIVVYFSYSRRRSLLA